jgi:hypothetical protein
MRECCPWFPIEQDPPAGIQLRLWVVLLDGRELEIHGVYQPEGGWDISLSWKIHVLKILFWQPISQPLTLDRQITKNLPLPKITPVLNECKIFNELILYHQLTPHQKQNLWIKKGVLLSQIKYHLSKDNLLKIMDRKHREAALWLWSAYNSSSVPVIIEDDLLNRHLNLFEIQNILMSNYAIFLFNLETELLHAYSKLYEIKEKNNLNQDEDFQLILKLRDKIKKFGDKTIIELYDNVFNKIERMYREERKEWVKQYGSDWLKYLHKHGYPAEREYIAERSQKEYPLFQIASNIDLVPVDTDIPHQLKEQFGHYLYYDNFRWHKDKQNNLVLAKSAYLRYYTLYIRFPIKINMI